MGETVENVARNIDTYSITQPLGVCVGITPFNFPAKMCIRDRPYRQLRKSQRRLFCRPHRSLPYRQLRNTGSHGERHSASSLPYRQLRNLSLIHI